jgi:hypothetical protein
MCDIGEMCDEVDDVCVPCDAPVRPGRVVLCHLPDNQTGRTRSLIVGQGAVSGHLEHGDTLGACTSDCP